MRDWQWLRDRLAVRAEADGTGCIVWKRGSTKGGYGLVEVFGRTWRAHRVAWMAHCEAYLPADVFVLHSCDRPACVNPVHLRAGTHRDNMDDRIERGPKGEAHGCSKLTVEQVVAIRATPGTNRAVGEMFGVTSGAIAGIRSGKNWRGVQ